MLRKQLLKKGQKIYGSIAYDYWGKQITVHEWGGMSDYFVIPKSLAKKQDFDIPGFLNAANEVAANFLKDFNLRDQENAPT